MSETILVIDRRVDRVKVFPAKVIDPGCPLRDPVLLHLHPRVEILVAVADAEVLIEADLIEYRPAIHPIIDAMAPVDLDRFELVAEILMTFVTALFEGMLTKLVRQEADRVAFRV